MYSIRAGFDMANRQQIKRFLKGDVHTFEYAKTKEYLQGGNTVKRGELILQPTSKLPPKSITQIISNRENNFDPERVGSIMIYLTDDCSYAKLFHKAWFTYIWNKIITNF